ncbi:hypothetical protein [Brevibacillus laterosporus]|uniref:hypothetical protein n=1 Tax=Brevibacillus laterosporus TaxID=1465 RepID=UPI00215D0744|nr:hypothetical protein [Brevibacillus laterosporus]MCR8997966.1 hypothetical protein [Brevibacillus laterosporus]
MNEYTECPECGNDQIIDYGEMAAVYETLVKIGKVLKWNIERDPILYVQKGHCRWGIYSEKN